MPAVTMSHQGISARIRPDLANSQLPGAKYWFSQPCCIWIPELMEVVSLAQAAKIKMLVEYFPLERAGEAYHRGWIEPK